MLNCPRILRPRACALAALALATAAPAAATAANTAGGGPARGQTVKTTVNLPAMVVDNVCNGDVVYLSGDLHITTTTTPRADGGYTVKSSADARNLRGYRIAPPPAVGYHGWDSEDSYSYYAAPPQPSQHRTVHWTRLVPESDQPVMYVVFGIRETVLADGAVVPVLDRTELRCSPPRDRSWPR